jgi:hypothetical protein
LKCVNTQALFLKIAQVTPVQVSKCTYGVKERIWAWLFECVLEDVRVCCSLV